MLIQHSWLLLGLRELEPSLHDYPAGILSPQPLYSIYFYSLFLLSAWMEAFISIYSLKDILVVCRSWQL